MAENSFFLVPDTNILLHYLDTLAAFADNIEEGNFPLVIVIPNAVVKELDWYVCARLGCINGFSHIPAGKRRTTTVVGSRGRRRYGFGARSERRRC